MTQANKDLKPKNCGMPEPVKLLLNNQPMTVEGPETTGREIKMAAISGGIAIQLDFHLTVVDDDGKEDRVPDDETIVVHRDERFFAVSGDDNS